MRSTRLLHISRSAFCCSPLTPPLLPSTLSSHLHPAALPASLQPPLAIFAAFLSPSFSPLVWTTFHHHHHSTASSPMGQSSSRSGKQRKSSPDDVVNNLVSSHSPSPPPSTQSLPLTSSALSHASSPLLPPTIHCSGAVVGRGDGLGGWRASSASADHGAEDGGES